VIRQGKNDEKKMEPIHTCLSKFPMALETAINQHGYIDEWASNINFDATTPIGHVWKKRKTKNSPCIESKKITYKDEDGAINFFGLFQSTMHSLIISGKHLQQP
jgi:hypothetical protein